MLRLKNRQFLLRARALALALLFSLALAANAFAIPADCYRLYHQLRLDTDANMVAIREGDATPAEFSSYGSPVKISRAAEAEGSMYEDIAEWFDKVPADKFEKGMLRHLRPASAQNVEPHPDRLEKFLNLWPQRYKPRDVEMPEEWRAWPVEKKVKYLSATGNALDRVNMAGRNEMFYGELLKYSDLVAADAIPPNMAVVNDWNGWELKAAGAVTDRAKYELWRADLEKFIEGKVGHQHIIHGWPSDAGARKKIAPQYIEMVDALSWYTFFRQTKRDPEEVESILFHKYLNVYTKPMLERLEQAMLDGKPQNFRERLRTIGAKNFSVRPGQEGGGYSHLVSIELRSGNKGEARDFLLDTTEARIVSGDYDGLRPYNSYDFQANVPTRNVITPWVKDESALKTIEDFEDVFEVPPLTAKFNSDPRAANHMHSKLISPLLPWENRLDLDYKKDVLKQAQGRYARGYLAAAKEFLEASAKIKNNPTALGKLRLKTAARLEKLHANFSRRVRLDLDFERYLAPKPKELPSILVKSSGDININELGLGIEYAYRFGAKPKNAKQADKQLRAAAEEFCRRMNCDPQTGIEKKGGEGHGHNLALRYTVTAPDKKVWRIEWDGIQRDYNAEGKPINPRGGHIEAPTPKFAPQNMDEIVKLYDAMAAKGNFASRKGGGAHLNFDLSGIVAKDPEKAGRRIANIISALESESALTAFLFQSPNRTRVAMPAPVRSTFTERLNKFNGTKEELGKLLYEERYFNPYVGRKPAYVQFNFTGMFQEEAPEKFRTAIDIKKPGQKWYPSFAGKASDRAEARLNDAPEDPYLAALQIKYYRAVLDRAVNHPGALPLERKFTPEQVKEWRERPDLFVKAARERLEDYGLDPDEFAPAITRAWRAQQDELRRQEKPRIFEDFKSEAPGFSPGQNLRLHGYLPALTLTAQARQASCAGAAHGGL
jgi:hypothetical protein